MEALKVNGDYEMQLFYGKPGPRIVNESLEFLAFYLSPSPIFTNKKYSSDYLDHVEKLVGRKPLIVSSGAFKNWWGPLTDIEFERQMNSKMTSAKLTLEKGWCFGLAILESMSDLSSVKVDRPLLVKNPFGMSGQGLKTIRNQDELKTINEFPVILEPLRKRVFDFSHYVFSNGKKIAYQNIVDERFQYRGTLFSDLDNLTVERLPFWENISIEERTNFTAALDEIIKHYQLRSQTSGYSVDSFLYEEEGKLKIQVLCEVNYRRTLGSTAFELAQLLAAGNWSLFTLAKMQQVDFKQTIKKIETLPGVILLSPPDVRYQMFLISAQNAVEGKRLLAELKQLLPDCQFSVEIE